MNVKSLTTKLLETVSNSVGPVGLDEPSATSRTEILLGDDWIPVEYSFWRAWTGRRMLWGHEFHGPVYLMDSPPEAAPWDGPRQCLCSTCQRHVQASMKCN